MKHNYGARGKFYIRLFNKNAKWGPIVLYFLERSRKTRRGGEVNHFYHKAMILQPVTYACCIVP